MKNANIVGVVIQTKRFLLWSKGSAFQACESSLVKKSRHVTGYHAVVGDGSCPRRASTLCWSSNPDWPWLPMGCLEYTSSNLLGGG